MIYRIFYLITESGQESTVRPVALTKSPRKFSGVVIATSGLPARGKSQVAQNLCRRLNWNGVSTKGEINHLFYMILK